MNFRKTSKRPLTPPPYFRKTMLRFFREAQKFATKFIRIGVTPPLFPKIHCFYRPKISGKTATKFFGSEMTPPPHSEVFRKFIEFGRGNCPLETYVIKKINLVLVIFCRIFRGQLRPTHPWLRVEGIVNYYLPVSLRPSWWCFNYQRLLSSFAVQLYLRKFCHRSWPPSWSTSCRFPCLFFPHL